MKPRVVVMGVSGSGKSMIGELLARELGVPLVEGDSFHPAANVEKMSAGRPLTDEDRRPWLAAVAAELAAPGVVVACSALKRSYRASLVDHSPGIFFVHLIASKEVLRRRLRNRPDHFMPASLLASQLQDLEPLAPDEPGTTLSSEEPIDVVVANALRAVKNRWWQR